MRKKEVFSNVVKRHKQAKWANGHFDKKVASLPEKMSVSFVLLITGTLPKSGNPGTGGVRKKARREFPLSIKDDSSMERFTRVARAERREGGTSNNPR